jgi:hypothetical protein
MHLQKFNSLWKFHCVHIATSRTCYYTSITYNFKTYYHFHIQILLWILVARELSMTMATGVYSYLPLLQVEGWCRGERLWLVTACSHKLRGCGGGVGAVADNSRIWWCPPWDTRRRLRGGLSLYRSRYLWNKYFVNLVIILNKLSHLFYED